MGTKWSRSPSTAILQQWIRSEGSTAHGHPLQEQSKWGKRSGGAAAHEDLSEAVPVGWVLCWSHAGRAAACGKPVQMDQCRKDCILWEGPHVEAGERVNMKEWQKWSVTDWLHPSFSVPPCCSVQEGWGCGWREGIFSLFLFLTALMLLVGNQLY